MSDIDEILAEVEASQENKEITVLPEENKEIAEIPQRTEDELLDISIKKNDTLEAQLDNVFNMFYTDLARGTDRSQASKEQMMEALKTKLEINKLVVEMAKIKMKKVPEGNKLGVIINTVPNSGINMDNIKNSLEGE